MDIEERKISEINEENQEIKIQKFVSIILKDKDGKLWLTKRINKEKPLYGKYSCPEEKMEENESQKQACSRELLEETNLTIKGDDESLKYIQTDEYSDNREGYVNTKRIVYLYELEHEETPVNTEPQNHEGWKKFILSEIMEKEIIDSVQKYIEWIFYKPQYNYIKTLYQCIRDSKHEMTEEFIREIEEEHPSFFMMRTINQTLEIGQIETKNFKYENAKEWPDLLQQIKEWKDQRTGKTFQEWRNERRKIHKYCYITKWNVQSPKLLLKKELSHEELLFIKKNYLNHQEFCIFYKIPQEIKFIAEILSSGKSSQDYIGKFLKERSMIIDEILLAIEDDDDTINFLKVNKTLWDYFRKGMPTVKENIKGKINLIYENSKSISELTKQLQHQNRLYTETWDSQERNKFTCIQVFEEWRKVVLNDKTDNHRNRRRRNRITNGQ